MTCTDTLPALPVTGETAKEAMARLRQIFIPALFDSQDPFYSYKLMSLHEIASAITLAGDFAEFGVFRGRCARYILNYVVEDRKLHLFDSFEGLPEDWVGQWKKGAFALSDEDIPRFDPLRVKVYKGWFSDTVPVFAKTVEHPLSFLHVDCDLYSSTKDVLWNLERQIAPGTIILFDEYMMENAGAVDEGEHQALVEWSQEFNRSFEYLWRTRWMQVAVRVTR